MANKKITWTNEKRKLKDLIPWERNPRIIREDQAMRLSQSFRQFGQVETIAISPSNDVYNGHQRLDVLLADHGEDYEVDCRVSSRRLTEKEREKLVVFLHRGATGDWDWDILANEFEIEELLEWGFHEEELGIIPPPPSLDELEKEYGEYQEDEFHPVIRIQVTPEIFQMYRELMLKMSGESEAERFAEILKSANVALSI